MKGLSNVDDIFNQKYGEEGSASKNGHTCVKVVFKPCFLQVWPGKPRFWPFLLPYLQGIGPTRVVATGMAITKRAKQRVMGLHDSRTHARLVGE